MSRKENREQEKLPVLEKTNQVETKHLREEKKKKPRRERGGAGPSY